ncbi:Rpn family recombination-promoting nuclease/putative transposase [Marinitoga lauensis]|uniref:Rpn family recombination-promoting nuclease/putative transposase n=1 Tax=Marinitoga lauensis TaxID=2201189 RepID=UPI0010102EE2|nr:Rpn family recombination-promoting nuclease/putative transposase [Marinitoga lauensis]
MGIYDQLFKELFQDKEMIVEFINMFLPILNKYNITSDKITIEKTKFTDLKYGDKESDLLYKINYDGNEVYVYLLLEHQSTVDYLMQFRILEYMVRIWRNYINDKKESKTKRFKLPPIIPVVLYNGSRRWTAEVWYMEKVENWQLFDQYIPRFKYEVVDLSQIDRKQLIGLKNALGLLLSIDRTNKNEISEAFNEISKALNNLSEHEKTKFGEYAKAFLKVLSQKNKIEYLDLEIEEIEEVNNMFERAVKAVSEKLKETYDEGKIEGMRFTARNLLLKKFGKDVAKYINNLDYLAPEKIEEITNNIFDITLEETIDILKNISSN